MKKYLLVLPCLIVIFFFLYHKNTHKNNIVQIKATNTAPAKPIHLSGLDALKYMLHTEAVTLNQVVINKVLTAWSCANNFNVDKNHILTVIDYSLPSNQKRLWVFNLQEHKLLFHTYVAHGINSGGLWTNNFSNKNNSKASSLGVYTTEKSYSGRDGVALRLSGLDRSFNDNASNRAVVMHGGWYVEAPFIEKYGRAGRSWGCPALPLNLAQPIIQTIKDHSFFVMYYPSDRWFAKSKFLNCQSINNSSTATAPYPNEDRKLNWKRANVMLAEHRSHQDDRAFVLAIQADTYKIIFHKSAPLARMLRRQINNQEFIALSDKEMRIIYLQPQLYNEVLFIQPEIKMNRGYYITEMNLVHHGRIQKIDCNEKYCTVHFEKQSSMQFNVTKRFIRWLGL